MRCRQSIDFMQHPWLPWVTVVMQDSDVPDALRRVHGEPISNCNFGNAVAVNVPCSGVDHVAKIPSDLDRFPTSLPRSSATQLNGGLSPHDVLLHISRIRVACLCAYPTCAL